MSNRSGWSIDEDLKLAVHLADEASAVALEYFARGVKSQRKGDGTVVTEADLAVERMLRDALSVARPDDAVLGEEFGATADARRRWILDPIDGTKNFVARRSDWGVHVALEERGEVIVGVVTRPALGRRWWAGRGRGAFVGAMGDREAPTSLHVSDCDDLAGARISGWVFDRDPLKAQLQGSSAWVDAVDLDTIMRVAEGQLEALVDATGSEIWDRAPLVVIVEEAGGRYRDRHGGKDLDLPGGVFTNGHIDDQLDLLLST